MLLRLDDCDVDTDRISRTEWIRRAVAQTWGVEVNTPTRASAVKHVRRSGNSLIVSVTDLAGIIGVDEGDVVNVTIDAGAE